MKKIIVAILIAILLFIITIVGSILCFKFGFTVGNYNKYAAIFHPLAIPFLLASYYYLSAKIWKILFNKSSCSDAVEYGNSQDVSESKECNKSNDIEHVFIGDEIFDEWVLLKSSSAEAAEMATQNTPEGKAIRVRLEEYGHLMALDKAEFFILKARLESFLPKLKNGFNPNSQE